MTDSPTSPAEAAPEPARDPQRADLRGPLALCSTALIAAAFLVPMFAKGAVVDADIKGAFILQWGLVMGYYFGSSKGSAAKDVTIAAMAKGSGQ